MNAKLDLRRAGRLSGGAISVEQASRVVIPRPCVPYASAHETASQERLAYEIARLFGWKFLPGSEVDAELPHSLRPYYVPCDTLIETSAPGSTASLRISGQGDLFGGMVPKSFVATKAITHTLADTSAQHPDGWSFEFGNRVLDAVLRGVTAFCAEDALRAGAVLLQHGPIRLKPVNATAGRGQRVLKDKAELDSAIGECTAEALAEHGIVLEEHLEDVTTFSVGQVHLGHLKSTYVGTQSLTPDNTGALVYGGSDLRLVRGDFDALLELDLTEPEREAIRLARIYDQAALDCYRGLYASRRNYDVAQGRDATGASRFGVLEQSWRPGGASMAEIYALQAFQQRPTLRSVRAFTHERFGESAELPDTARVTYRGKDEKVGFITKCAGIHSYDDE